MEKRKYKYGDLEVMVDASLTPEQVREHWASIYPELSHANIVDRDGVVEFVETNGTKG